MSCVMQAKSAFLCIGGECFYNLIMAKKLAKLHCLGQNKIESYFSRIGVNAMNKNVALYNEMIAFLPEMHAAASILSRLPTWPSSWLRARLLMQS